jgi:cytochrome c oxidase subunit 3
VLLISSLTAAWAVRNAQLKQQKLLLTNIVITVACACTFMVVKYFEYSHKAHDGLLWGPNFDPKEQVWELDDFKKKHPKAAAYALELEHAAEAKHAAAAAGAKPVTAPAASAAPAHAAPTTDGATPGAPAPAGAPGEQAEVKAPRKPTLEEVEPLLKAGLIGDKAEKSEGVSRPRNAHVFFSIYFFMTGLHGLHVLIGIGIWVWLFFKAKRGVFGPNYFGPIDYAALYWHLVDLIWIYLFPLLYLIH